MILSCAAESWESWEEEAVKYLKEKKPQMDLSDGAAATALASTRPQHGIENTFEIDRGSDGSDGESGDELSTLDDLNDLTGLQHLFNEFFSSINTVEQYREPNVRECNRFYRTVRLALLVLPLMPISCPAEHSNASCEAAG